MLQVLELSPIISQDITSVSGTRMCWTGMPRRKQWLMPRTQSRLIVRWRMLNSDLLICAPMLVNWLFSSRYVIICFGLRLIITPQLLPDVPEPSSYWSHDDPRALAHSVRPKKSSIWTFSKKTKTIFELSCYDMVIDHILSIAYGMGIAHGMSIAHRWA